MTEWKKSAPPSVGWWPASTSRLPGVYRWWNGFLWSKSLTIGDAALMSGDQIDQLANSPANGAAQSMIEWTERPSDWPDHSKT